VQATKSLLLSSLLAGITLLLCPLGCAGDGEPDSPLPVAEPADEAVVVPPGKADDFFSLGAQEYLVEGTTTVTLEDELAAATEQAKQQRVRELINLKHVVIGWFLYQKLKPDHDDPDAGFNCLTKNGSYEDMNIQDTGDGLTYSYTFRHEIGGVLDLLDKLPTTKGDDGKLHFTLIMGKISNAKMAELEINDEWYREAPWSSFNPENLDDSQLEQVDLAIWAEPRSDDAWIDYDQLFADGEVTIGIHFGWDYAKAAHRTNSKKTYNYLVYWGYASPVWDYDSYTAEKGPLTRTIDADGKQVVVKVWLYWGQDGTATDPNTDAGGIQLENDLRESLREREIIMFSGHSGAFYGFALANWKKTDEGDLDDSEIATLDMPSDVYQVLLVEGCETYGMAQGFWDNPNKADRKTLDILTSTTFSPNVSANNVTDFIASIAGTGNWDNIHAPKTYREILELIRSNHGTLDGRFGVHGLDNNPHLHPYVDPNQFCSACEKDSDCGQSGYKCARLNESEKACFGQCTADDGCPAGYKCMDIASGSTKYWMACVPASFTCSPTTP